MKNICQKNLLLTLEHGFRCDYWVLHVAQKHACIKFFHNIYRSLDFHLPRAITESKNIFKDNH